MFERTARYFVTGIREEHLLVQWITSIMIVVHWGLGIVILVGGVNRFSLPTYQPLVDISGGHVWMWGVVSCIAAALMMVPLRWPNIAGLWIGMLWMIMWTTMFAVSVVESPNSAATPVVAYAGFVMINAALLTTRVIEKSDTGR